LAGSVKLVFSHLLVALDESASAGAALDFAIDFAHGQGARITVVHAVEQADRPLDSGEKLLAKASEHAAEAGLAITTECLSGMAAEQIAKTADRLGCDLIVLGGHGRPEYSRTLVGSVATRVMHWAHTPTLVIHEQIAPEAAAVVTA
jgi:nucleotide-binding universal stress UspA family protein